MVKLKAKNNNLISKYTVIYFFVAAFCVIATFLIPDSIENEQTLYLIIALVGIIELILFLFANTKINGDFINFLSLFVLCLYLFHFGQVILVAFFPKVADNFRIVLRYFEPVSSFGALRVINASFAAICFGGLLKKSSKLCLSSILMERKQGSTVEMNKAKLIICLTFPIKVYIDLQFLIISLTQGFSPAKLWLTGIPDILVTYSEFVFIGFGLLIFSLRDNPRKKTKWFCVVIAYILLIMLSGRRSENVAYLCILTYIFIATSKEKIQFRKIIILGCLGYLLLTFLYTVVYIRNLTVKNAEAIVDSFIYVLTKKNAIFEALREYGNSGYTPMCVINIWLENNFPSFGKSYILGLSSIFINITGVAGKLTHASNYGFSLQEAGALMPSYTNIGGSVLGELFFNFGSLGGVVVAILLGYVLSCVSNRVSIAIKEGNYKSVAYLLPIMFGLFYWIRDYFSGVVRGIVWGVVFGTMMIRIVFKHQ